MNPEINEKDVKPETPAEENKPEQPEEQAEPKTEEAKAENENAETPKTHEEEIDEWRRTLEIAVKQRDDYLDSLRRTQADFQNFKRRNQTARADGFDEGEREIVTAMLPVIDNLERAIAAADGDSPMLDGVKLTLKSMTDALGRFGLEELPAEGCEFNPDIHHAVMREVTDDPGKVIEVFQKGYKVKDRVIRYAMVKVSVEND